MERGKLLKMVFQHSFAKFALDPSMKKTVRMLAQSKLPEYIDGFEQINKDLRHIFKTVASQHALFNLASPKDKKKYYKKFCHLVKNVLEDELRKEKKMK